MTTRYILGMANPGWLQRTYLGASALLVGACSGSTTGEPAGAGRSAEQRDAGAWQPPAATGENRNQSAGAGTGGAGGSTHVPLGGAAAQSGAGAQGGSSGHSAGNGGQSGKPSGGAGAQAGSAAAAGSGGSGSGLGLSGPTRCDNPQLLMCESFESGIDKNTWRTKLSPPTVDDMHAARGSKALHVHTGATGGSGLETSKLFPSAQGHYYGRMFVYFDALPTSPAWAHWTIAGANPVASSSDQGELRVGGQFDGKLERFGVGTDHGPTGDWTNLDQDPAGAVRAVALKQWLCVEWLHDWEHDETSFYLDGVEHPSLHTTANVKHLGNANVKYELPELGSVWVGFWNYDQGSKAVMPAQYDTWIDEVAFDDERIGCDK